MLQQLPDFVALLRETGPYGALIAAAIIGLTLALILAAHFLGLWTKLSGGAQSVAFQERLLKLVDKLQASEDALRRRVDALDGENTHLRDEVDELRAGISLLRNQRRRLIEFMRDGRPGTRPAPALVARERRA